MEEVTRPTGGLLHRALEGPEGSPIERAQLTDQQRLAVVLQAAALLAHLEYGGGYLPRALRDARLDPAGRLRIGEIAHGRMLDPPQVLLRRLLERLFRADVEIAGRGEARRAARWLHERWQQTLVPLSADAALADVFEAAEFLWLPAFGPARSALAAEHRRGGEGHLWVAGPGGARRRLLARVTTRAELEALLAGDEARALWEGDPGEGDPSTLAQAGRFRRAVLLWRRHPPASPAERLEHARALFALGRFSRALGTLEGVSSIPGRLLRARCQTQLGRLRAARRVVDRLGRAELGAGETVELAEVASRLHAKLGQGGDALADHLARALARGRGPLRIRALVAAAEAAWDRHDPEAMERYLEQAREARPEGALGRRWHHARALLAQLVGDGPAMAEALKTALGTERRLLSRDRAGRLWNDLALARVMVDDLPGAERACRHALRLLSACEGPSRTTLGLHNLAEVRLRRGRLEGASRVLEAATSENRRAGNLRGLVRDLALWVRLELAQGRPEAALTRCDEAFVELDRRGISEGRELFELFAARALGWLGRRAEAAENLGRLGASILNELESEERPAVMALAGLEDRALELAAEGPWTELWRALAGGEHPRPEVWDGLERLEPYRAGRLVFDCEEALPGVVPPRWLRRAAAALRESGSTPLAERLEIRTAGPWRALEAALAERSVGPAEAARLLRDAGYPETRLLFIPAGEEGAAAAEVVVAGDGGERKIEGSANGGRLVLEAEVVDAPLRAIFSLFCRELSAPKAEERAASKPRRRAGMVGEDPALNAVVDRLERLAPGEVPILVLGESGTGKELVARAIHRASARVSGPFIAFNCAAISESLVLADLFGHVRGSFTGADRDRPGLFESARGGTVFLDEIGDLPAPAQGMLLRVLQESEIRRVGESFSRKVDVRVVAATHRDLEAMVREGEFRRDLFFRLKVATLRLPPLRERGSDVVHLAEYFLTKKAPGRNLRLGSAARANLLSHLWPGNVRELENVLEVAIALADGDEIKAEDLDLPTPGDSGEDRGDYHARIAAFRKQLVIEALEASRGRQAAAARRLGVSRQTLSYLVRQMGLS